MVQKNILSPPEPVKVPETLEDLIEELRRIFESEEVDIESVKRLMASYKSNPEDWLKFVRFSSERYTRNLVDRGNGKYNLMILCWPEKITSSIHDHSDAHCIMKSLSGSLYEVRFQMNGASIEKSGETCLDAQNSVAYINDSIGLHRVENREEQQGAVTLHLYCPPFNSCHTYDEATGEEKVAFMTFDTEPETRSPQYTVTRRKVSTTNLLGAEISKDVLVFNQSVHNFAKPSRA